MTVEIVVMYIMLFGPTFEIQFEHTHTQQSKWSVSAIAGFEQRDLYVHI